MTPHAEPRRGADENEEMTDKQQLAEAQSSPAELPEAARRALAEAKERRRAAANRSAAPQELGGRGGLDPARYGDWEAKGIASDF